MEAVYYKLNERYSREVINHVHMNFYKSLTEIVGNLLNLQKACVYIDGLCYLYLHSGAIQTKIKNRLKTKWTEDLDYLKSLEKLSFSYTTNKKWIAQSSSQPE